MELASQVEAWYELENYSIYKQADARLAADQRAHNLLESTTYRIAKLWAYDSSFLPKNYYSAQAHIRTLEKRLDKDSVLKSKYTETIKEDLEKGYVIPVRRHDPQLRGSVPPANGIYPSKLSSTQANPIQFVGF